MDVNETSRKTLFTTGRHCFVDCIIVVCFKLVYLRLTFVIIRSFYVSAAVVNFSYLSTNKMTFRCNFKQ